MRRVSLTIRFLFVLMFMGMLVFNPLFTLKAFAAQSPPVPPVPLAVDNGMPEVDNIMKDMNRYSNDAVSIGQDRIIGRDEVVENDAVVIGADLTVYGQVNGDAVCIGGDLKVGPQAVIKGDLVNVGGRLDVDPSARVYKDRINVGGPFGFLKGMDFQKMGGKISLITKILRIVMDFVYILILLFFALLLTTFMPRQLKNIEEKLSNEFPKCVLLGIASMIGIPIIILAFVITLVGILAVPFLLLAFVLSSLAGYIIFSRILGGRLLPEKTVMLQILIGLLLLHSPLLAGDLLLLPGETILSVIGHVFRIAGVILLISINFIGLGAVLYSLLSRRGAVKPHEKQPDDLPGSSGNGDIMTP